MGAGVQRVRLRASSVDQRLPLADQSSLDHGLQLRAHGRPRALLGFLLRERDSGGTAVPLFTGRGQGSDEHDQVDLQIAKQGFRLAAWLNVLFDGSSMLP